MADVLLELRDVMVEWILSTEVEVGRAEGFDESFGA